MSFNVFVEGAVDPAAGAIDRLAAAMSSRYGIPAADLAQRMSRGRFRVKANVDRATAETYVKDLEAIGARAVFEEARLQSSPSIQPPTVARTMTPTPAYASGLAAAFAPSDAKMDLGALGDGGGELKLSAIDGSADVYVAPPVVRVRTPSVGVPVLAPPVVADEPIVDRQPFRASTDMFLPPDAEEAEQKMELADDEIAYRKSKTSIPPVNVAPPEAVVPTSRRSEPSIPPVTAPAARRSEPSIPPATVAVAKPVGRASVPAGASRARFAIIVAIAIVVGFIPAHIVGRIREKSYAEIDARVTERQLTVTTSDEIAELEGFRKTQLAAKESKRSSIALVSMLIWLIVGGGGAFAAMRFDPARRPSSRA